MRLFWLFSSFSAGPLLYDLFVSHWDDMGVKTGNTLPYSQDNLVVEASVAQNGDK